MMSQTIDEQLKCAEERVRALKKRKAEQKLKIENKALRDEVRNLKLRIESIGKLSKFDVNFRGNNGEKLPTKVVKFDDVISALNDKK